MISRLAVLVAFLCVALHHSGLAQQAPSATLRTLNFQTGHIVLSDGLAQIDLTDKFRFIDSADSEVFLTKVWSNPPGSGRGVLGMVLPADVDLLSEAGWAIVVTYEDSGHVSDDEAGKIDYDDLMREMQQATDKESKERLSKGEESIELLGWAQKPYYDSVHKKLFWAKRLRFGNSGETLNYNIRVLGRTGVLNLNIVSGMDALDFIEQRVPAILSMTSFTKGNTYADFNASSDHAAEYGLAGLIAGGVLAKAGFFKGLLALLLASKKLFAIGFLAAIGGAWAAVKRLIFKKPKPATYSYISETTESEKDSTPPPSS